MCVGSQLPITTSQSIFPTPHLSIRCAKTAPQYSDGNYKRQTGEGCAGQKESRRKVEREGMVRSPYPDCCQRSDIQNVARVFMSEKRTCTMEDTSWYDVTRRVIHWNDGSGMDSSTGARSGRSQLFHCDQGHGKALAVHLNCGSGMCQSIDLGFITGMSNMITETKVSVCIYIYICTGTEVPV